MFDLIIITAANEAQATGYRSQVESLKGILAPDIIVEPDPGGKRVGSLGSTVNLLCKYKALIKGKRVLVCHSGGDSKRLPAYAAIGKAFVPVPQKNGSLKSLFEIIVGNMEQLALPDSGMLVVCGDVAPKFDFSLCDFSKAGVTGVGYLDSTYEGSRHGVYVPSKGTRVLRSVAGFLQKPDVATAEAAGAIENGKVYVDTGILWIDGSTCEKLSKSGWFEGDIYEKFTYELVKGYAGFSVNVVPSCSFFHIGTSAELLDLLGNGSEWIEGCEIPRSEMKLAGQNIVTGVPQSYGKIRLGKGECLLSLPIGEKDWVHVKYLVTDTFKTDGKWEEKAYKLGRKTYAFGELMPLVNQKRAALFRTIESVRVEKPLRVDFAGGWSDTPPICYQMGGCVLNAAVALNGVKPVKVEVRRIADKKVFVESVDLKKSGVYATDDEIADHSDPHDWGALVKSALTVVGYKISDGGLHIRLSADVPKGSGLGTSSILGAALVEALGKVRHSGYTWKDIAELTLRLEKEMHTGGGWQDQVGGLMPGVKLLTSRPGDGQHIEVKTLSATEQKAFEDFLEDRALLYFTGRKRMARNVLFGVLEFFKENPYDIARSIITRIKNDAAVAFKAVKEQDWQTFCAAVNGYWLSKKALDPGSTNPLVESIIARVAPWTSAVSLCGAGGGGFMLIIAHDNESKQKMRKVLKEHSPIHTGRFYDFKLV